MLDGVYVQFSGALLFCLVFFFLWKQSGVRYFGYWSLAWSVESLAFLFTILARTTGSSRWLAPHSLFEFGFALSLVAAARVGSEKAGASWRSSIRVLYFFPAFLLLLELIGWNSRNSFQLARSVVMSAIYLYSFRKLGFGAKRLFQFTLLALSLLYAQNALAYLFVILRGGSPPGWMGYLSYLGYFDLVFKTLLAFSAMAMWIENQQDRVTQLASELDRVRRESARDANLDRLTGLLNQSSLDARLASDLPFDGVAIVCDLDDFKSINDRFGHLVGDEVLRNVGSLLKNSIRASDAAFRWGGDEFVILFDERNEQPVRTRMSEMERRLRDFRIRGHGSLRIVFSWGAAAGAGAPLRAALDAADQEMYARKRERSGRAARPAAQTTST